MKHLIKNKEKAINQAKKIDKAFYEEYIVSDLKFRYEENWEQYDSPEYFDYYEITNSMIPEFVNQKNISIENIIWAVAGSFLINEPYGLSNYFSAEGLLYALSCKISENIENKEEIIELLKELKDLIEKSNSVTNNLKETLIKYIEESIDILKNLKKGE